MGRCPVLIACLLFVSLTACTSDPTVNGGPRLIQEATSKPTVLLPTPISSPTPVIIPVATSELATPVKAETVEGQFPNFVLITPTLPPSKTPTPTATVSPTFTNTPPATATSPLPIFPTYQVATPIVSSPAINPQSCSGSWFFTQALANTCPMGEALKSDAAYQQFQQGFMIWVGKQDAIYVFYDSVGAPRWQVFKDNFVDGDPDYDPALAAVQPSYTWQPRRGFGLIWRGDTAMQARLGWAVREWEEPFDTQVQIGADGTVFMADAHGGIISLLPGGRDWLRYVAR